MLVGGLGLGFTLDRVLGDRRVEQCDVVEIEQALVEWMRDGTIPHGRQLLADDRARVVVADIAIAIAEAAPASYDLVLLDVDNGPGYLVHEANAALYREPFLAAGARAAHARRRGRACGRRPASPELRGDLRAVFGEAEERSHDVRLQDRDERYWLYVGRRDPAR